jgi:hypothetical protein
VNEDSEVYVRDGGSVRVHEIFTVSTNLHRDTRHKIHSTIQYCSACSGQPTKSGALHKLT